VDLLVLVAGIGLFTHFSQIDRFIWIIAKFFILLMLAVWPVYLYGDKKNLPWLGVTSILLGLVAAVLAFYKPF